MNSFFESLSKVLRQNIREYGMYIALALIMVFFNWIAPLFVSGATPGIFLSSRNIANLVNQTGYIAVLAVGMTL
jgi:putative multiple sugar transport system permease protein